MLRSALLALLALGMLPTLGCAGDIDAPSGADALGEAQPELGVPSLCLGDDPPPELCGWKNGWTWPNGFERPDNGQADVGWRAAWRNRSQDRSGKRGGLSNSWAIAFEYAWGGILRGNWSFPTATFKWIAGTSTCAHPLSRLGGPLAADCSPIVKSVCRTVGGRPSCCSSTWDATCVDNALAIAASGKGPHSVLETGAPFPTPPILTNTTDAMLSSTALVGPVLSFYNDCAVEVCKQTGYGTCCTSEWGASCVKKAVEVCSSQYLARPRYDAATERVMVDACVEPEIAGFPKCPLGYDTTSGGKECCRRALVLRGLYQAEDTNTNVSQLDNGMGRRVNWYERKLVSGLYARVTLVPDPCDILADGTQSCEAGNRHKLWQAAGPHSPLYPDCPGTASAMDCGCTTKRLNGERCTEAPHANVGLRALLATTMAALITTDGAHEVWFRWKDDDSVAPWLGWGFADFHPQEAEWYFISAGNSSDETASYIETRAACYSPSAPQRAGSELIKPDFPPCPYVGNDVGYQGVVTYFGGFLAHTD